MSKKTGTFQMRMSAETRAKLDRLAEQFNLTASAVVNMLIARESGKREGD